MDDQVWINAVVRQRLSLAVVDGEAVRLTGLASRMTVPDRERVQVRGRDLVTGLPKTYEITLGDLRSPPGGFVAPD